MTANPLQYVYALATKLRRSWAAYWLLLALAIGAAVASAGAFITVLFALWLLSKLWLATVVAEAASTNGESPLVWGLGTVFLGPVGGLLLPWSQLSKLQPRAPGA